MGNQDPDHSPEKSWHEYLIAPKTGVRVEPHPLEYARNRYGNWEPPLPRISEDKAIALLKAEWTNGGMATDNTLTIELNQFEIYRSPVSLLRAASLTKMRQEREYELYSLHKSGPKPTDVCFNGIISLGQRRYFVEDVRILHYSIQGYGDKYDPGTEIFVQSATGSKDQRFDIWYLLKTPSSSYGQIHDNFHWVATFGKHFIDFLAERTPGSVTLHHFREIFMAWLVKRFSTNQSFVIWWQKFGNNDFRQVVNAHARYLFNQALNLPDAEELHGHRVWKECLQGGYAINEQPIKCQKTTVTPLVNLCFKDMYFGRCLQELPLANSVQKEHDHRKSMLGFPMGSATTKTILPPPLAGNDPKTFKVGDIVGINPDADGPWKKTRDKEWVAYVQRIEPLDNVIQRLFILWLYRPTDTIISDTMYPIENELFFSDNCNCTEGALLSTDILRKYSVEWNPKNLGTNKDILVTRKYVTQDSAFVSLKDSDFRCACGSPKATKAVRKTGDTVYIEVTKKGKRFLEPVVVSRWNEETNEVTVRLLSRLSTLSKEVLRRARRTDRIAANELAWTNYLYTVAVGRIRRECHIRFFELETIAEAKLPTPYDRDGSGDFFFLCSALVTNDNEQSLKVLSSAPEPLRQGENPSVPSPFWSPLRGLSIFSGGGNLDRGIEDSGAVHFSHVVDISENAVHTQLANAPDPKDFNIYWGSVDDYQRSLSLGNNIGSVARIGEIQFIAAGSPCPGFSLLQRDWLSEQSLRNASHITSFCSFLDIYRPQYAVLENVVEMTNVREEKGKEGIKEKEEEKKKKKVFAQLVGCLVALGYQVQQLLMDAWNYGSSQRRSRVFVLVAAPGLEPLPQPPHTHSHPDTINGRSLGKGPNGEFFGCREGYPTPFQFVSAGEATAGLPDIGSNRSQICIPIPDHIVPRGTNGKNRQLEKIIPLTPSRHGYRTALDFGLIPPGLMSKRLKVGTAFTRINPAGVFPTITTSMTTADNRCAGVLHWRRPTMITIMEARRAQGFPDCEVIIGSPAAQFKIIGNAVDRKVSLAIGLSVRKAMDTNQKKGIIVPPARQGNKISPILQSEEDGIAFECAEDSDGGDGDEDEDEDPISTQRRPVTSRIKRIILEDDEEGVTIEGYEESLEDELAPAVFQTSKAYRPRLPVPFPPKTASLSAIHYRLSRQHVIAREQSVSSSASSLDILLRSTEVSGPSTTAESESSVSSELDPLAIRGKRPLEQPGEVSQSKKKTRHSGLQVEYTPKRWDRSVENGVRRPSLE